MKHMKALIAAALGLLLLNGLAAAQTRKPRPKPATTTAKPAQTTATTKPSTATTKPDAKGGAAIKTTLPPDTLATLDDEMIFLRDLDAKVSASVTGLDKEIEEMRRTALEEQIGTYLLEAEAKKRNVTMQQLLDAEVNSRVAAPSEAEVRAFYDANTAQMGGADYNSVRPQIAEYLRQQAVQKLIGDMVNRLRLTTAVTTGADPNAANLAPSTVLATVGGRAITKGFLEERLKPYIYKRRLEVYGDELAALNYKIYEKLLAAEAKKRNTTPDEVFRVEVTAKVKTPSEADVAKFYEENKGRIQGDLPSLREQISNFLLQQDQRKLVFDLNQRLRAAANLRVMLTEPEPPVQAISTDDDPSRGEQSAPVTIVVFTDFQCPACAATHPVIDEALKTYGTRVRLVVRDFPLPMHAQARKAAEAANAANAQGKFFDYINVLFKNQTALDVASLKKYAADLGLNTARFNAALDSGEYAAEVEHDMDDGAQYGVDSTPAIFINGVRLRDLTVEALRAEIERALARGAQSAPQRATK